MYHTKFDAIKQVPLGSLQRTGDNILALAKGMAQGHQLSNVEHYRPGNLVFFDFLGAFVIRWPMAVADFINVISVIVSFYCIFANAKEAKKYDGEYTQYSVFYFQGWVDLNQDINYDLNHPF